MTRQDSVANFNQLIGAGQASEQQVARWVADHSDARTGAARQGGHFADFAREMNPNLVRVQPQAAGAPAVNQAGQLVFGDIGNIPADQLARIREVHRLIPQDDLDRANQQHEAAMREAQDRFAQQQDLAVQRARHGLHNDQELNEAVNDAVDQDRGDMARYMALTPEQQDAADYNAVRDAYNAVRDAARRGLHNDQELNDAVNDAVDQDRGDMANYMALPADQQNTPAYNAVRDAARQGYVPENDLEHVTQLLGRAYEIPHVDAGAVLAINDGQAAGEKLLDAFTKAGILQRGGDFNTNQAVNDQNPDTLKNVVRRNDGNAYQFSNPNSQWNFFGLEVAQDGSLKAKEALF
ncbi:MAG: hypothetical protein IJA14_03485 [Alphaproteobacteria bacterium]|nr:hypothetical protein [Alphaproteobacteria bacterium]